MLQSNEFIPSSYIEKKVYVTGYDQLINQLIEQKKVMITMISILIHCLAKSLEKHSIFNSFREKNDINIYKQINIGFVISLDGGLSIPVIKNCNNLQPEEITEEILRIRKSIMKKTVNVDDLTGSTFTVSG